MAALNFPSSPTNNQVYTAANGSAWKYNSTRGVWNSISGEIKRSIYQFTNIGGETSVTVNYVPNNLDVYLNGVKLVNGTDFAATNGTSVNFTTAIVSDDDYVEVVTWASFQLTDSYSPADASTSATASTLALRDASADLYANSFISSSDERVKKDVVPIENALDVITALQGLTFTYTKTGEKSAGFIAQEFEKVLPDLVHTDSNGMKSINYLGVIAYLVEAIKELRG
jgi:hypothetical protein